MNISVFLKKVDARAALLSQEQLMLFIHNIARTVSESSRMEFLSKLNELDKVSSIEKNIAESERNSLAELQIKLQQATQKLSLIDEGELALTGCLNEEYDDWYDDIEDEYIFMDPKGVLDIIENVCALVHQCLDYQLYKEGYGLAENLLSVSFFVEGDYQEYCGEPLYLTDLTEKKLISYDYRRLVLDALQAAYHAHSLPDRPDALYRLIYNSRCQNISLEDLIQDSRQEPEQLDEFLDVWTCYLGKQIGEVAEKFITEAVALSNDAVKALTYAKRFVSKHPGLYEQIMQQTAIYGDDAKLISIGQEALDNIPVQFIVRSRIALLTAGANLRLGRKEEAEICWLKAFQSDTKPIHFLRLLSESTDSSRYIERAREIYQRQSAEANKNRILSYQYGELCENKLDSQSYSLLAFFDGKFQQVINDSMNIDEALGWSNTFMKTGIALFLLYLYQREDLSAGCQTMCEKIVAACEFSVEGYTQGLNCSFEGSACALFWKIFSKWKRTSYLTEAEQEAIISRLEKWIQLRVAGIMRENRRKYYYECAAFIAALGEVKESRGEIISKGSYLELYRSQYARRSAFHQELRAFGMTDRRKLK